MKPTVTSIADSPLFGKGLLPQPQQSKGQKRYINQHSRRRFLAALMLTRDYPQAKRLAEVAEPYASQFVVEALREAGIVATGMRFPKAAA